MPEITMPVGDNANTLEYTSTTKYVSMFVLHTLIIKIYCSDLIMSSCGIIGHARRATQSVA